MSNGLWICFIILTVLGILSTVVSPLQVVFLVANIFVAPTIGFRLSDLNIAVIRLRIAVRCLNGELAGQSLELGSEPIVIGRVPDVANVIVPLQEISAAHVHVWTDAATGGLWIEDISSHNGTYVWNSTSASGWVRSDGPEALAKGDRFCLCGEELAAFEIQSIGEGTPNRP